VSIALGFQLDESFVTVQPGSVVKIKRSCCSCSPDEAQRNPGRGAPVVRLAPDCHPGYMSILRLIYALQCAVQQVRQQVLNV